MESKRSFSAPQFVDLSEADSRVYQSVLFSSSEVVRWFQNERERQIPHFLKPTASFLSKAQTKFIPKTVQFSSVLKPTTQNRRFFPSKDGRARVALKEDGKAVKRKREETGRAEGKRVKVGGLE